MNLSNKIRELRKSRNLTQEQLAEALCVSPQAVSKWELGTCYPDMGLIPTLAYYFNVSLDTLFDFDAERMDREIEEIRVESGKFFWDNFEKAERILLDGLKSYPASLNLKTELFELYAYNADRGDAHIRKALALAEQILAVSQDVFCTCRTKSNIIHIYEYLDTEKGENHTAEIEEIIHSLPYIFPYMLQDRMRLAAQSFHNEEGLWEANQLKNIEWQELFIACCTEGNRYRDLGDYEHALSSYTESVDIIERFMYPDKNGYDAYPIGGTHANHAMTLLDIAACKLHLNKPDGIDELIARAKHIYFDAYENIKLRNPQKKYNYMREYFAKEYLEKGLDAYAALDLSEIDKRIADMK